MVKYFLLIILNLLFFLNLSNSEFICQQDGHFGDENDCSKYYHCANGRALEGFCPNGLFWNKGELQKSIQFSLVLSILY